MQIGLQGLEEGYSIQQENTVQQFRLNLSCNLISEFACWCNIWYLGRIPSCLLLDWVWCYILLSPLQGIWQGSVITIFSKQSTGVTKQGGWSNVFSSSNQIICMIVAPPPPLRECSWTNWVGMCCPLSNNLLDQKMV